MTPLPMFSYAPASELHNASRFLHAGTLYSLPTHECAICHEITQLTVRITKLISGKNRESFRRIVMPLFGRRKKKLRERFFPKKSRIEKLKKRIRDS